MATSLSPSKRAAKSTTRPFLASVVGKLKRGGEMMDELAEKRAARQHRQTAFGRVLSRILERRGLAATEETVGQRVLARMATRDAGYPGPLADLADELELRVDEMLCLSLALMLEQE